MNPKGLIDSFILGEIHSIDNLFNFIYIIGKKYNLFLQINDKYLKYLNDIAELCLKFTDEKLGVNYCNKFSPFKDISRLKSSCYSGLSII